MHRPALLMNAGTVAFPPVGTTQAGGLKRLATGDYQDKEYHRVQSKVVLVTSITRGMARLRAATGATCAQTWFCVAIVKALSRQVVPKRDN